MITPLKIIYYICLALVCALSLKSFGSSWPKHYRSLTMHLALTLVAELLAISWSRYFHKTEWWDYSPNNYCIYNIAMIPRYLLLFNFLGFTAGKIMKKKWLQAMQVLYAIVTTLILFLCHDFKDANTYNLALSTIITSIMLFTSLQYFVKSDEVLLSRKHPFTWIALGLLTIHLLTYSNLILAQFHSPKDMKDLIVLIVFRYLLPILNIISYSLLAIAFLCKPYSLK